MDWRLIERRSAMVAWLAFAAYFGSLVATLGGLGDLYGVRGLAFLVIVASLIVVHVARRRACRGGVSD